MEKSNKKNKNRKLSGPMFLIQMLVIALIAFFFSFMIEIIVRNDFNQVLVWIRTEIKWFILQSYLIYAVLLLFYFLRGRISSTISYGGFLCILMACIEYFFYLFRGDTFSLEQLALTGEATKVIGVYTIRLTYWMIVAIAVVFVLFFISKKGNCSMPIQVRIMGGILAFSMIYTSYEDIAKTVEEAGAGKEVYIAKHFYDDYGYITGLFRTAPQKAKAPEEYCKSKIEEIYNENTVKRKEKEVYPDIIFIQNETLYYLEQMKDMQYNEEPLQYIKSLQQEYTSGKMLSPMAGGGTCNVEYEVLSGYPYANTDTTPYVSLINKDFDSIVSLLREKGYYTAVMHPNDATFFNRDKVYSFMGFDEIDFPANMDPVPADDSYNGWAGDSYLYQQLIKSYENRDTDKPYFATVITTQNHGGYGYQYDAHGIKSECPDLQKEEAEWVNTYGNLERQSDESFKELISYFEQVERPTIIVMWGDHCPAMAEFGIHDSESTLERARNEYTTPLVIWNNYNLPKEDLGYISAYKVGAYVLEQVGISDDSYFDYLNDSNVPCVFKNFVVSEEGELTPIEDITGELQTTWDSLWLLQYDRMFGKNYTKSRKK